MKMSMITKRMLMSTDGQKRNYYCSQKFWWLSVDVDRSQTLSCCAASPENIDVKWLVDNPGQLFNSPKLQQERSDMLQNIPVSSCAQTCWNAEDLGLPSRRTLMKSNHLAHQNLNSDVETLHILLGNDCNMSCVYCCKQYSSSWARDIMNHGPYQVNTSDDRYLINAMDKILIKLSQKEIANSQRRNFILEEIYKLDKKNLKEVTITGGEPFLNLSLQSLVDSLDPAVHTFVWSGLGVDPSRFRQECKKIKRSNLEIVVSVENIEHFYEFNRNGNTWKRFCQNIDILDELEIKYSFNSTVSNLTLFGLPEFFRWAGNRKISWGICNDPKFLSPHVIDEGTKKYIIDHLSIFPEKLQKLLIESFDTVATPDSISDLKSFLGEFAKRQSKFLDIFPKHFLDWIKD